MLETDVELIQACRQGDAQAWERLINKYERLVYFIPLNYGLSLEDAADVAQITFTILLQSLDSLRDGTHLANWLKTVARRHTWRSLEHNRSEPVKPDIDIAENESLSSGIDPLEQWDRVEWLHQGLNKLSKRCRELLIALYFDPEQPSYEAIAKLFNIPLGSIGPIRARCLERLKKLLTRSIEIS